MWLHEPIHTFQNLHKESIQLHATRSVQGRQPTFSRKLASKQLDLRVSPDKQMVTVCTQGENYQAVIISQAAICSPNRTLREGKKALSFPSLNTRPIKSYTRLSIQSPGECMPSYCKCHPVFFPFTLYLFTSVFLFYSIFFCLLTAVQTTCCPSFPLWLCGASVPS